MPGSTNSAPGSRPRPRDKGFGNARLARNLFEASVARQASRVVQIKDPTNDQLTELRPEDLALGDPHLARKPMPDPDEG